MTIMPSLQKEDCKGLAVLAGEKLGVSMSSELKEHKLRANPSSSLERTTALIEIQKGEASFYHLMFGLMGSPW